MSGTPTLLLPRWESHIFAATKEVSMCAHRWNPLPPAGRSVLIALAATSFALLPTPVRAQPDTGRQVSPTLLRALAEAADGYRTGQPVWVVASYAGPPFVVGVYATRDSAARVARDSAGRYDVFGPYVAAADQPLRGTPTLVGAALTFRMPDGRQVSVNIDLTKVDALFLSMSAVDKFAIPYYARLYGPGYASHVRALMAPSSGGCHIMHSTECLLEDLMPTGRRDR